MMRGKVEASRFELRLEMVRFAQEEGIRAAARAFRNSRNTVRLWVRRYEAGGAGALVEESRAPKHIPHKTSRAQERKVIAAREAVPCFGRRRLKQMFELAPSKNAIGRILREKQLTRRKRKKREKEDLQAGSCFYCSGRLRTGAIAVDHFIPWRRYPTDLGHNFVLAHAGCNGQKADRLVAERPLLERWVERNGVHGAELEARFERAGVPYNLGASVQVARWAYGSVERVNGQVWVGGKVLEHLRGEWVGILAA